MVSMWRVVAISMNGSRTIVEQDLTEEQALNAAREMMKKGNNVTIEGQLSPQLLKALSRKVEVPELPGETA